jgi:uncharacterized protein
MNNPPSYPPPSGPPSDYPPSGAGGMSQSEERNWALAAHVGSLVAAFVAMAFLAPLLVLLVQGDKSAFVRRHAVESLNFQISLLIYLAVAFIAGLLTLSLLSVVLIPLGIAAAVAALVFIITATMAASRGEEYTYPLTIRLVK